MKLLSISVNGLYTDGFSYQENLLPLYQKKIGNDVFIICSEFNYDIEGKISKAKNNDYTDNNGLKIKRIPLKKRYKIRSKFKRFSGLYDAVNAIEPDVIFCHLFQFLDLKQIIKYVKKHPSVKLFIDNHADFNNSGKNYLSKNILHGVIWKKLAHSALPYAEKFYGVLPARVDFLKEVYKLPAEKCEVLLMGADDDEVNKALEPSVREEKRREYGASDADILILAGGKIDHNKPQILILMKAVNEIADKHIRLLVFGNVSPELKEEFENQLSDYVKHIGWKTSNEIYSEFAAADIVAFPGLHSVYWEQAVGMGKPCVFRKMQGFTHIDLDGNCMFFGEDTEEDYARVIKNAAEHIDDMKSVAEIKGRDIFSYTNIAKKSLEY